MNFSAWRHRVAESGPAACTFVLRNLARGRRLRPFAAVEHEAGAGERFAVGPAAATGLADLYGLYAALNGGRRLEPQTRLLLRLRGERFCLTARRCADGALAGMALYYFNARDRDAGAIHEAYIGLMPPLRGMGLGTFMRRHALRHFAGCGLDRVSSRVSAGNLPSLKGNMKLGFLPVETYFDSAMAEQRHYLICDLGPYR
ncbi:MAG TPA: GNAT family N-acetyltransferase [Paucimonas sp.]|nr:GNAT family N-acetyltransferase [Paucimonas sp.]